jgi:hypothetical protein
VLDQRKFVLQRQDRRGLDRHHPQQLRELDEVAGLKFLLIELPPVSESEAVSTRLVKP